jgi:sec-independent protein translocase protein TatC
LTPQPTDDGSALDPKAIVSDIPAAQEEDRSRMGFLEHLDELRRRLLYSIYAVAGMCGVSLWFMADLSRMLLHYFRTLAGGPLLSTQLPEAFMFQFKLALFAGLILASPFVFTQLWLFVAPGLYAREKKVVIPFVLTATILFSIGVWFSHAKAFPTMVGFLGSFRTEDLEQQFTIAGMFSFYVKMALALGLIFEMPMLVFFLARFGIVTAGFLYRKFKYAVLIIFILAAVLTPTPDIATQLMFVAPMLALYVVSIGVAWAFGKKKPKNDD